MNTAFDQISHLIRPHFLKMQGYVSAGMLAGKDETRIFLNANENPFSLPGLEGCNRYPEPQPANLLKAMAGLYDVRQDQITITRGADEAIKLVTQIAVEPFTEDILITPPTFGIYKVDADAMPARKVVEVPLLKKQGTFFLNSQGIKNALDAPSNRIKLIYLTSPNNPTGNNLSYDDLTDVIQYAAGKAFVIMDETYAEFTDQPSFTQTITEHPHLIILRTLSKSYSMAGMRIGCVISGVPELTTIIRTKVMETYPIPRGSSEAALKIFEPGVLDIARQNIKKLITERERMVKALNIQNGIRHIYPSDANFLLVEMERAHDFYNFALSRNVIMRDISNAKGTENCIRLTLGTPSENDLVLALLKEFYG
ncbi:MAG: histidinol-phosphate transaminase [Alphaproteobacteria bacterium]|nr:histidinol-phosphate transaminase [Alphaproteobacteria bacterium]|tara:strand:+ start:1173 stop:2276 length:1104 start_codon:yes stop_codon:yes gene_type:complete